MRACVCASACTRMRANRKCNLKDRVHCDKTLKPVPITVMPFHLNVSIFHLKQEPFRVPLPLLRHVVSLNSKGAVLVTLYSSPLISAEQSPRTISFSQILLKTQQIIIEYNRICPTLTWNNVYSSQTSNNCTYCDLLLSFVMQPGTVNAYYMVMKDQTLRYMKIISQPAWHL